MMEFLISLLNDDQTGDAIMMLAGFATMVCLMIQ